VKQRWAAVGMLLCYWSLAWSALPFDQEAVAQAFAGRDGCLSVVDVATGETLTFRPERAAERVAPCSTFKIWNTLLGLNLGLIISTTQPFYAWDGVERPIAMWNADLTLQQAFTASCVPAFQELARRIGPSRMGEWLAQIAYGDQDMSAGVDRFWLPDSASKSLLISPVEQTALMRRLVLGQIPSSPRALATLDSLMSVRTTERGRLCGKTGTGHGAGLDQGLFVGHVRTGKCTLAFACQLRGAGVMGKDARKVIESLLERHGLL